MSTETPNRARNQKGSGTHRTTSNGVTPYMKDLRFEIRRYTGDSDSHALSGEELDRAKSQWEQPTWTVPRSTVTLFQQRRFSATAFRRELLDVLHHHERGSVRGIGFGCSTRSMDPILWCPFGAARVNCRTS